MHAAQHQAGRLRKTLTWRDGFAIAMVIPNGLLLTVGDVVVFLGMAVVCIAPLLRPRSWHAASLTWYHGHSRMTIVVWFYVTTWTTYGTEICATFAPEYRDTVKDTSRALRSTSLLCLGLFVLLPLTMTGSLGEQAVSDDPVGVFAHAFEHALGGFSTVGTVILIASMFFGMVATTADGGRALYGLARERLTIRQLDHLNRWGVPGRALTLDAVINSVIVLLLGEPLGILVASNFGYLVAITLAVAAFLLLRKDRPHWPRPIRRAPAWTAVAWLLLAFDCLVLGVGITHPSLAGYGGPKETLLGIGVLLVSVLLYLYRCVVQDRRRIVWRIETPSLPEEEEDTSPGVAGALVSP